MSRRSRSSMALLAVLGALAVLLATGGIAGAASTLHATLSGKAEVPRAGNGTGSARLTVNLAKHQVCYRITLRGVGQAMAGHIHKGKKGTAGPVVVPLFTKPTSQPKGCAKAKTATLRTILKNPSGYYVNVHTKKFPAGAARGQLH